MKEPIFKVGNKIINKSLKFDSIIKIVGIKYTNFHDAQIKYYNGAVIPYIYEVTINNDGIIRHLYPNHVKDYILLDESVEKLFDI